MSNLFGGSQAAEVSILPFHRNFVRSHVAKFDTRIAVVIILFSIFSWFSDRFDAVFLFGILLHIFPYSHQKIRLEVGTGIEFSDFWKSCWQNVLEIPFADETSCLKSFRRPLQSSSVFQAIMYVPLRNNKRSNHKTLDYIACFKLLEFP